MYCLKQASVLAYTNLVKNVSPHGYVPYKYSTGLWRHKTKKTSFFFASIIFVSNTFPILTLIIYWILLKILKIYIWTLKGRTNVDWPLTGIKTSKVPKFPCHPTPHKYIKHFLHPDPEKQCYASHKWTVPEYGQITKHVKVPDNNPPINEKYTRDIHSTFRKLL